MVSRGRRKDIDQYDHKEQTRLNNPPAGLVTSATDPDTGRKKIYAYDPHLDPQLVWAGKAEHTSFEVPTVSLHVHERIDPRTIIEAVQKRNGHQQGQQLSLWDNPLPRGIIPHTVVYVSVMPAVTKRKHRPKWIGP